MFRESSISWDLWEREAKKSDSLILELDTKIAVTSIPNIQCSAISPNYKVICRRQYELELQYILISVLNVILPI